MRPISLEMSAFGPFADKTVVAFEKLGSKGLYLITGDTGAGKTTILHTVSGLLHPKQGSILFEGRELTKVPAHKVVSLGMAQVPEGRRVFSQMTVLQNLKMGAYTRSDKDEIEDMLSRVYKRFPRLERFLFPGGFPHGRIMVEHSTCLPRR